MEKGKGWIQTALLTAVGIMSGLVGSSWQQYLTVKLEQAKSFDSWRREAYVSYLSGMEKRRISQDNEKASRALKANTPEQRRLKAKADQLKDEWEYEVATGAKKIGVFGNTKVVVALANHWRQHFEESRCGSNWETDLAISERCVSKLCRMNPRWAMLT